MIPVLGSGCLTKYVRTRVSTDSGFYFLRRVFGIRDLDELLNWVSFRVETVADPGRNECGSLFACDLWPVDRRAISSSVRDSSAENKTYSRGREVKLVTRE